MNLLISTIGRRGYIADYFRAVPEISRIHGTTDRASIHAGFSSGCMSCDAAHLLPSIADPDYIDAILEVCKRNQINLILPLYDQDCLLLSQHLDALFNVGVTPILASQAVNEIAFDKLASWQFLNQHGLPGLETFKVEAGSEMRSAEYQFLKPRFGFASQSLSIVNPQTRPETQPGIEMVIQQHVKGIEYGLDVLSDFKHNVVSCIVKRKIAMRSGETDQAVTVKDPELLDLGVAVARALQHIGPLDIDVVVGDSGPKIIDINARFGGGYPLSHAAGADFPARICAMVAGNPLEPGIGDYQEGLVMLKEVVPRFFRESEFAEKLKFQPHRQQDAPSDPD